MLCQPCLVSVSSVCWTNGVSLPALSGATDVSMAWPVCMLEARLLVHSLTLADSLTHSTSAPSRLVTMAVSMLQNSTKRESTSSGLAAYQTAMAFHSHPLLWHAKPLRVFALKLTSWLPLHVSLCSCTAALFCRDLFACQDNQAAIINPSRL